MVPIQPHQCIRLPVWTTSPPGMHGRGHGLLSRPSGLPMRGQTRRSQDGPLRRVHRMTLIYLDDYDHLDAMMSSPRGRVCPYRTDPSNAFRHWQSRRFLEGKASDGSRLMASERW